VYFGQLTLKVSNIRLKTVGGSHLDREKVMIILLELLAGGVLREEQLGMTSKLCIDHDGSE